MENTEKRTSPQGAGKSVVRTGRMTLWQAFKLRLYPLAKNVRYARSVPEAAHLLTTGEWFVSDAIIPLEGEPYLILMRIG